MLVIDLMTIDEIASVLKANTPGEAKGWISRVGIQPVDIGGRIGLRYLRQDVLEAIEAAHSGARKVQHQTFRRPPLSKRPITGRSRKELVEELSGPPCCRGAIQ